MSACWRAFQAMPGFESMVLAWSQGGAESLAFSQQIMDGINCRLFTREEWKTTQSVSDLIADFKPDVVVLPGWLDEKYREVPFDPRLANVRFVMTMDTPFVYSLRQQFGRWRMRNYFSRIDRVAVPGEKAAYLARTLHFPDNKVFLGLYGINYDELATAHAKRLAAGPWPRRFLFTGRYNEVKALDVLMDGYRRYRDLVNDPWPITCCGAGPEKHLLDGVPGVEDRGFVQPQELTSVFAECGAFVLASRYDPWPLVIVEASAAGLPLVHSDACGSAVECVRSYYSGLRFTSGDTRQLAQRLKWLHDNYDQLPQMGARAQQLAAPYGSQFWAQRWAAMLRELVTA